MVAPNDIPDELVDALLANYQKPDDLLGKNGILEQLTKRGVGMVRLMMDYERRPSPDKVRYMTLSDFKKQEILPLPHEVIAKAGR